MASHYICSACNYQSVSWYGKCPSCNQWNTLKENFVDNKRKNKYDDKKIPKATVIQLSSINKNYKKRIKTNIFEFDRVIGGGFMPGEVILLTGEPGVGKSTLLLKILTGIPTLYAGGEESVEQIKHRVDRLNTDSSSLFFTNDCQIESILNAVNDMASKISIIVIDSIQTIYSKNSFGNIGNISQLRDTVGKMIDYAKSNNMIVLLVGHVTKEGSVAGPKTLEHLVDCVLYLEGDRSSQFRILRAQKNRFGSTDEIGIFEMTNQGLVENKNVFDLLNEKKTGSSIGKTLIGAKQGSRSFFYEIQCLANNTYLSIPKRIVSGLDYNRAQLLIAVADKYLKLNLNRYDIYLNVIGGLSVRGTSSDLGIITAIFSSIKGININGNSLYIGEVGLLGEVRKIFGEDKIIREAKRYKLNPIINHKIIDNISQLPVLFNK